MNRIAKCFCMLAVIALAFTACKKNENDNKMLKFNGTTEQLEIVDDEIGGRMYIDANNVVQFDNGDQVAVFNIYTPNPNNPNAATGSQCDIYTITNHGNDWSCPSPTLTSPTTGAYYAYYPASLVNIDNLNNQNRATFTLDDTQEYRLGTDGKVAIPENALYAASKADQKNINDAWFDFKNICGVLSLNLYDPTGTKKVTRIELTDDSFNLVGDITLKIHEVDPVEMTALFRDYYQLHDNPSYRTRLANYMERVGYSVPNVVSKTLTLDCSKVGGVQLSTSEQEPTEFLFVLRPLALRDGCSMRVFFEDGYVDLDTDVSHVMSPNQIRRMRPINVMEP